MLKSGTKKAKETLPDNRRRVAEARPCETRKGKEDGLIRARIAERAYFIWHDRGQPAGQDLACWYEAEKELRAR